MAVPTVSPLRFGVFEFAPVSGDLRRHGLSIRLTPQARELLRILLEIPIRTHTREEIRRRLWPENTYVDFERGVNKVVCSLRAVLGESARSPRFIETVATEGYRFLVSALESLPTTDVQAPESEMERLAVLPVRTEPEAALISMSKTITSLLTEKLATTPGVRVMAESTVRCQKLENPDPRQIGESLGVKSVVAGELMERDGELSLQLELIDAADGALRGSAVVKRCRDSAKRCEKELTLEVLRRIRPFLDGRGRHRKLPHRDATVVARVEKVS